MQSGTFYPVSERSPMQNKMNDTGRDTEGAAEKKDRTFKGLVRDSQMSASVRGERAPGFR